MASPSPSTSSDVAESPASAAARVFATPELLEHILLDYARAVPIEQHSSHSLRALVTLIIQGPVKALYVWQRIDKTTKSIIMGSSKLRRYMWIDYLPHKGKPEDLDMTGDEDHEAIDPLVWLLAMMRRRDSSELALEDFDCGEESKEVGWFRRRMYDFFFERPVKLDAVPKELGEHKAAAIDPPINSMLQPTASWRSLRILRVAKPKKLLAITCGSPVKEIGGWYYEQFKIDGKATLGDFYEWLTQHLDRDLEQYADILRHTIDVGIKKGPDSSWHQVETKYGIRAGSMSELPG